jgi:hypothetical protein
MALTDCVAARCWPLSAVVIICVSTLAQTEDTKTAPVPVEAAKVIAAPFNEQVTAVGTLFTLFVIPVVYTYLSRRVFMEADDALTPDTSLPALPAPKTDSVLEPAE